MAAFARRQVARTRRRVTRSQEHRMGHESQGHKITRARVTKGHKGSQNTKGSQMEGSRKVTRAG
eukprot:5732964-Lingulodinium_polyedra.AAC.1